MQVRIVADDLAVLSDFKTLAKQAGLSVYTLPEQRRDLDPVTLQLIITGVNVLVSLLNVFVSFLNARQTRTIRLRSADGWEVAVPAGMQKEEIAQLIAVASAKQATIIRLER